MDRRKSILQSVLLIIIVTITGYLGLTMPIIAIAYPILLTFIGLKNGIYKNVVTFITSLILIGVITTSIASLIIPLQYGILSVFTVYMINKGYKINKVILYSLGLVFLMVLIHMGLKWVTTGINTFAELEASLIESTKEQLSTLDTKNMSEADISELTNILKTTVDYISSVFPALLIISSAFIAYINYYISSRLARNSGRLDIAIPRFSRIIFPRHIIMGSASLILTSYILKYVEGFNYLQLVNNILILMYVIFLVEGLSLTVYLIKKMKMGTFFKVLFVTVIALSSFLNILLFSIGIIDIVLDFRKIRKVSEI